MENTKRKYNTNSQSPASKAARQRTAHEYDKKMIELGLIKKLVSGCQLKFMKPLKAFHLRKA
ncbi:hypothetical protein [Taylorella equigenitalis]|uniref:hypothetical protein n=1 Tax=Taylorella equigenitalis TaxID=29575 RepID=UPI0003F8076A|nr:hypothetical protein [Taylorella equigenitalis]ASY30803.1 hypothetical protein B9Z30_05455 [Taylorella equigenitalis]KOS59421.1 hypothetical protein AM589_00585 [Taylorella equigenitalis]WDU54435.1 hypothetical protein KPZ19_05535 [Taylorella equigenitalis]